MHTKGNGCHLSAGVGEKHGRLFVGACGRAFYLACYFRRRFVHKAPYKAEGIYADVKKSSACKLHIEKSVFHIIVLKASEIHGNYLHLAEASAFNKLPKLFVDRHMPNSHRLTDKKPFFPGKFYRLVKLPTVESDWLFYKNMLVVIKGFHHKRNMGVVGSCDVNNVNFIIIEQFVVGFVNLLYAVLFGKSLCFGESSVAHSVQGFFHRVKRLSHFISYYSRAQYSPV